MLNDFKGVLGDFLPLYFHDSNHWAPDKQIKVFSNFVTILPRYSIFKKLRGMLPIASASNRGVRLRGVHQSHRGDRLRGVQYITERGGRRNFFFVCKIGQITTKIPVKVFEMFLCERQPCVANRSGTAGHPR